MNTQQSSAHRETTNRRLRRRIKGLAVFVLALLLLLPFAGPVNASPEEQVRNEPVVISDQTEIVFTSTGPGQAVNGALPPAGATWPVNIVSHQQTAGIRNGERGFAGHLKTQDAEGNTAQMYCIDIRTPTSQGWGM